MTRALFIWTVPCRLRSFFRERLGDLTDLELQFPDNDRERDALVSDAEVLVGWQPTAEMLDAARKMRAFINPGAGVEHLRDLFCGRTEGCRPLLLNGHGNSALVAQHAVALLLALTNQVIPHHQWMAAGRWRTGDREVASRPLRHQTVGLLGYGAIGRKVHRLLAGFDVRFAALRTRWPAPDQGDGEPRPAPLDRYTSSELDDFLDAVDVLVATLPSTPETQGLLDRAAFRRLGPDGLFVNVGRGTVVVEDDLYEALAASEIAGAAVDVWYDEPDPDLSGPRHPFRRPFHTLPNIVLSPHRGASPLDDLERWSDVAENLRRLARGDAELLNVVDLDRGY